MKIVVTGALGHIGSRLIRELPLLFPECEIFLLDNLSTQRYNSLFQLPVSGQYRFFEGDILSLDLPEFFWGAEAVIHLAAFTDPAKSFQKLAETEKNNVEGTVKVAEACLKTGAALFFPSTTSVYGKSFGSIPEDFPDKDLNPQTPYAASKLKAEQYLLKEAKEKGLRFSIVRFGTIFGVSPGMRFHTAVNKFCWHAAMGQPVTVWKNALDQIRPYLDLEDAVGIILFMIARNLFEGEIYNAATFNLSVRTILETIQEKIPQLEIQFLDSQTMNPFSYEIVSSRLVKAGFCYGGDLKKAIWETLELLNNGRLLFQPAAEFLEKNIFSKGLS